MGIDLLCPPVGGAWIAAWSIGRVRETGGVPPYAPTFGPLPGVGGKRKRRMGRIGGSWATLGAENTYLRSSPKCDIIVAPSQTRGLGLSLGPGNEQRAPSRGALASME